MLVLEIAGGILLALLVLQILPYIVEVFIAALALAMPQPGRFLDFMDRWLGY